MSSEDQEPQEEACAPQEDPSVDAVQTHRYENDIQAHVVMQGHNPQYITHIHLSGLGYADAKKIATDVQQNFMQEPDGMLNTPDMVKQIVENLQSLRWNTSYMDNLPLRPAAETAMLPVERAAIEEWYYALAEQKQYIVQAVALLHGGRTQEIDQLRTELYQPVYEEKQRQDELLQGSTVPHPPLNTSFFTFDRLYASGKIFEHTHIEFRVVNEIERTFWVDTDEQGVSAFGLRLLHFFSQEATRGGWGPSGPHFLQAAQRWAETPRGDAYWRAAYALGVIWRCIDREQLQRLANTWAANTYQRSWRRSASLLYGAYMFERASSDDSNEKKSQVLAIVLQWVTRAHTYSNIQVGSAAAYVYGLIGRNFPVVALQGLSELLKFPLNKNNISDGTMLINVFAAIVSNYVNLGWTGHVRLLLQHIAWQSKDLALWCARPEKGKEIAQYRFQRKMSLEVLFNVFFIISATSLADEKNSATSTGSLSAPLAQMPVIPDPDGRDTLLVGVLIEGADGWRNEVMQILCAAIFEKKSQNAFHFLQQWTSALLKQQGDDREVLRQGLVQFFVGLANMLGQWSQDLARIGIRSSGTRATYVRYLNSWTRKPALKSFVEDVLAQIEE